MPDADKLTPADPSDLASALAYALRYQGRKRVHNADEIMAEIVAKRADCISAKRPAMRAVRRGLSCILAVDCSHSACEKRLQLDQCHSSGPRRR
jgi:hypothetical protein